MTVANIRFFSDALGKWTRYNAILPDVGEGPYPVLMQLHGLSDDEDSWIERSNLVRYVGKLPNGSVSRGEGMSILYDGFRSAHATLSRTRSTEGNQQGSEPRISRL